MPQPDLTKIAQLAKVSRSTVSRVVNEHPDVNPEVRKRILKIIKDTGYQPNLAARSLRNKQTGIIGLVVCNTISGLFTDPYFPQLIQGVAQACNQFSKTLALFLEGDPDTIFPRIVRRGQLDGILLQAGKADDYMLKKMMATDIPFVYIGRPTESRINFIDVDNLAGGHLATSHLIRLKRHRIASIFGPLDTTTGIDRKEGYLRALNERGIPYREELTAECDFTELGGYQAMKDMLKHNPDAVFSASDTMARGAIRAITEAGLSVPNDVAVVGFDDLSPAVTMSPLLTTIRQPITHVGARAVETLLDIIQYRSQPAQRVVLNVELVIRESCGG
jgi:LacI family transcriptional regulator